jgi:putative ABC transport system permease protein
MKNISPPKTFLRFFRWFCHPELKKYIEGDLMELYSKRLKHSGKRNADIKFIADVLLLFRPGIIRPAPNYHHVNNYAMFKSYFKIGWRNLLKNKGYSMINIGGLAMGMTVAMLIGLWVNDELSFNRYHKNYDRIASVMQNQTFNGQVETWNNQALQLGPELRNAYGSNFKYVVMGSNIGDRQLSYDDKKLSKSGNYMDPEVIDMLSLKMISGDRDALKPLNSIVLSESVAKAFFGDQDPINKVMKIDNRIDVKVTGVYEDIPYNSDYANLTFIAPFELMVKSDNLEQRVTWGNSWFDCTVQIADNVDMQQASINIKDSKLKRVLIEDDDARFKPVIFLHPMNKWHLYSDFQNGVNVGGRIQYVWMFGLVGVFILLLACINFMNLSTARSEKRAKEVGIRKTIGSIRSQLVGQFFTESFVVVGIAFLISVALIYMLLPYFNEIAGKKIALPLSNPWFWSAMATFTIITGLLAGSYPALFLSSFQPVKVLKGAFHVGRTASIPRQILVVLQFTVSITIIIGTIVVFRQIQYAMNRPLGYDNNGIISSYLKSDGIRNHYEAFRQDLLKTGAVVESSLSDTPITNTYATNSGFKWSGKDPNMTEEFVTLRVSHEFGKMINWKIKEGRDFSRDIISDSTAIILNESAVTYTGLKNPVGEIIDWGGHTNCKVIGVVEDLVTQSPFAPVKQMIFILNEKRVNLVSLKINPTVSTHEALAKIEPVFKKYDPENAFEYQFEDEQHARKFGNEKRIGTLSSIFATLGIFISCLGLFGLASFVAEQRTKEIGIRKVLGATVFHMWRMLSRDFLVLVVISCVIAVPLSLYFMNDWLQQYEYRTTLSWEVFALAALGALLITLATVSYQSVRAALANPVKSLRSE